MPTARSAGLAQMPSPWESCLGLPVLPDSRRRSDRRERNEPGSASARARDSAPGAAQRTRHDRRRSSGTNCSALRPRSAAWRPPRAALASGTSVTCACSMRSTSRFTAELMSLAREARESGWWTEYEDLDLDPLIGLEQEATSYYLLLDVLHARSAADGRICSSYYQNGCAKNGSACSSAASRSPNAPPGIAEGDNRPRFHVLLDEVVFHRGVGSPSLMAAQLGKILKACARPQVSRSGYSIYGRGICGDG